MSEPAPLVSMVVTTYRAVDHLRCLVDGLLRRPADPDLEFVLYGDGGGEGSREAIAGCEAALRRAGHRVVARYEPVNRGIVPALNGACRLATGRWLFVVNDDMVFADGWLDAVRPHLRPGRGLSLTCAEPPLPGRRVAAVFHARDLGLDPAAFDHEGLQRFCAEVPPGEALVPGANYPFLVERAVFEAEGGADERFPGPYHDPDLFLRLKLRGLELVRLRRCLAYHFSGVSLRFLETGQARPSAAVPRKTAAWLRKEHDARLHFVAKWGAKPRAVFGEIPRTRASAPWEGRPHGAGERLARAGLLLWERLRCRARELSHRLRG